MKEKQPFKQYLIALRASYIVNEGAEEAEALAKEILSQVQKLKDEQSRYYKNALAFLKDNNEYVDGSN